MVVLDAVIGLACLLKLVSQPFAWIDLVGACIAMAFITGFGLFIYKKLGGLSGVITKQDITINPTVMFGYRTEGPAGRFAIVRFESIQVESISQSVDSAIRGSAELVTTGPFERVRFIGKRGTPNILIADALPVSHGVRMGEALGELLELPVKKCRDPH